MNKYCITSLHIYPVKSLGGIDVSEVQLCPTGFRYDRRWMLVDETNRFITQREIKQLCLFKTTFSETGFIISYEGERLQIPFALTAGTLIDAVVWDDTVSVIVADDVINEWFGKHLQKNVRLVYQPDDAIRPVDAKYAVEPEKDRVSLADGYPVLIIGESALNELNARLPQPLPMDRFRPNLVFSGGAPHAEDEWRSFHINGLKGYGVKPCGRCVITTINQDTAEASAEPLKTLRTYRKQGNKILFGQNALLPASGTLKTGDIIVV